MPSDLHIPGDSAEPTFTRSSEFVSVFCDVFRSRIGNGECAITFSKTGYTTVSPSNATNVIEERAEIILSWQMLKVLVLQMASLVAAIEEEDGPIRIPASFAATVDARYNNQVAAVRSLELVPSPPIPRPVRVEADTQETESVASPQPTRRGRRKAQF